MQVEKSRLGVIVDGRNSTPLEITIGWEILHTNCCATFLLNQQSSTEVGDIYLGCIPTLTASLENS